jgi:hypothetical protein
VMGIARTLIVLDRASTIKSLEHGLRIVKRNRFEER